MTARRLTLTLLATALACAAPLAALAGLAPGPDRGRTLFLANCAVCHGPDGRADTPVARLLEPRPRNFADPIEMARVTDDRIYRAIKAGRPGTAMAAWGEVLAETEIGDLIEHIRTLARPLPPGLTPEQLSLEVGRRIYEKECAVCHGRDGRADTQTARALPDRPRRFADPVEMARIDDGRMYSAIKLGRVGTAMGGWGELMSPVEIIDVMRYLRSLQQPLPPGMTPARLDVVVGGEIYREHCVTCHGEKGDARTALGQSLVPRVPDLTGPQAAARLTDRQMAQMIAQGVPGTSMAPWGGILNQEDVRRVVLFIRQTFQRQP